MKLTKTLTATLIMSAAAFGTAYAQDTDDTELLLPTISFADAVEIASTDTDSPIVEMALDYAEERPVYLAHLEDETSMSTLMIDALEGEVVARDTLEAKDADTLAVYLEQFSGFADLEGDIENDADVDDEGEFYALSEEELEDLENCAEEMDALESCLEELDALETEEELDASETEE